MPGSGVRFAQSETRWEAIDAAHALPDDHQDASHHPGIGTSFITAGMRRDAKQRWFQGVEHGGKLQVKRERARKQGPGDRNGGSYGIGPQGPLGGRRSGLLIARWISASS